MLRTALRLVLVLALVLASVPVAEAHGGWRSYIVTVRDAQTPNGTVVWFTIDNRTGANPTVPVHANQTVILHFVNVGSLNHTLEVGSPIDVTIGPVSPGNESSASFQMPADPPPRIAYRDPAWEDRGARGVLAVPDADEPARSPGPPLLAVLVVAVGLATVTVRGRRR